MRQLFELNSMINNPVVFAEYNKAIYGDDKQKSAELRMDKLGLGHVFVDEATGAEFDKNEVDDLIKSLSGMKSFVIQG